MTNCQRRDVAKSLRSIPVYVAAAVPAGRAVAAAVAGRYAMAALVFSGLRRFLQKTRRYVAKMFSASGFADVRVDLENVRDHPFVETGRAHGAGVSRVNASSC